MDDKMRYKAYLFVCGMLLFTSATAQLNENCVVSVLNRNVQAKANGTWVLPNIPANFGNVRARVTCMQDGVTSYGQSAEFSLLANGSVTVPPIILGPTTPIPTGLNVNVEAPVLVSSGATTRTLVMATYANGNQVDVSGTGTSYSVSNPAVATITSAGLITAVSSGTVMIQAINEGAQGITQLRVALSNVDSDGDGIPDEEELRIGTDPNIAADAEVDQDRDGLSAVEEYRAGTDPRNRDSDGDGIGDGEELRCTRGFCTSPLKADSDGDGVRDGTEIQSGSDPSSALSVNMSKALRGIRIMPDKFTLTVNSLIGSGHVQLTVVGTMIDGVEVDLTGSARQTAYASSNLESCNFGGTDGLVHGSTAGACVITATNNGHSATTRGTVLGFTPGALSFIGVPGFANGLAIDGNVAYIAAGAAGLQVVALGEDRRAPKILAGLSLNGNANDITLAGNLAYLATSAGLAVIDISTPATPRLVSQFATESLMGVKVRGTTAYVVTTDSLWLLDTVDPRAIARIGALKLGGTGWNLDLDRTRNLAAVAMGEAGIKLVDVSRLSAPLLLGTAFTGDARGVVLRGNAAIVADQKNSMLSVDLSNLAAPLILSRTPLELAGLLNGVALAGNFALGAEISFVGLNVPVVDLSNPQTLLPRTIINFPDGDGQGTGIAADERYIYLIADPNGYHRGGISGDSRLYIAQYQPRLDLAGMAPTATITAPLQGAVAYEGASLTAIVDAIDDVTVESVRFLLDGQDAFTGNSGPYQYTFRVPAGISTLQIGATANDLGGNEGLATPVTISIVPDPLTQVTGQVVDDSDGAPLAGAIVVAPGGRTSVTDVDGRFRISDVPTVLGDLILHASFALPGEPSHQGASVATTPVTAGVTDMGTIRVFKVWFETDYGTTQPCVTSCGHQLLNLPFDFPFYGVKGSQLRTYGSNAFHISAAGGFVATGAIVPFANCLSTGSDRIYVNSMRPDRYIITFRSGSFSGSGSKAVQVQLFDDGRIVIAFRGMPSGCNLMTGVMEYFNENRTWVDFSASPNFYAPADTSILELFDRGAPFDLDNGFLVFTPSARGGFEVQTILATPLAPSGVVSGAVPASPQQTAPARLRAAAQRETSALVGRSLAGAEVRIRSAGNPNYLGMTNMDAQGSFALKGVPPGSIGVEVWRNGILLARGTGSGRIDAEPVQIDLVAPEAQPQN